MDRERIEQLVRMAHEIEQLEAQAAMRLDPSASRVESPWSESDEAFSFAGAVEARAREAREELRQQRRAGRWRRVVVGAAVVLLGTMALQLFGPWRALPLPRSGTPVASAGTTPSVTATPDSRGSGIPTSGPPGDGTVIVTAGPSLSVLGANEPCDPLQPGFGSRIIAMVLDGENDCRCSQTVLHQWDGSVPVSEISRADLLRIGFEAACMSEPTRILVVAVSGPVDELPETDEDIAALAHCVDIGPTEDDDIGYLGHDEVKYAAAAMACIARGLTVETATLLTR